MRNLFFVHCRRFLFRWESFAVTLVNILLAVFAVLNTTMGFFALKGFMPAIILISLCCTAAAVTFIELSTISTGAIRNPMISGYSKGIVFLSKFFAISLFSAAEGAICIVPPVLTANLGSEPITETPALFTFTILLMFAAVCCISMTVCLLFEHPTVSVIICIGALAGIFFGGKQAAIALDFPQYILDVDYENDVVNTIPNLGYIGAPKRDVYDQLLKCSPVQPLNEYERYWEYRNTDALYRNNLEAEMQRAALHPEQKVHAENARLNLEIVNARIENHAGRIALFPVYQCAVLSAVCIAGTLIFRKRNLK